MLTSKSTKKRWALVMLMLTREGWEPCILLPVGPPPHPLSALGAAWVANG